MNNPCQVSLTMDSVKWIQQTETFYLLPDQPNEEEQEEIGNMSDFCLKIILDLEDAINLIKSNINFTERILVQSIITQCVNQRYEL